MKGSALALLLRAEARSPSGSAGAGRPITAGASGPLSLSRDFSASLVDPGAAACEAAGVAGTAGAVAAEAGMPGAGGKGLAGFLPYRGALGSQFWFLRDSAASWSAERPEPLFTKGIGTLVT